MGFEPTRAEHIGLAVQRLNHSATSSGNNCRSQFTSLFYFNNNKCMHTLFCFYKNVVFPAQTEYSYFAADFRLKIFLYYS